MGWKTALTVVRGATVADLATAGYTPDGTTTSGDEASAAGLGDDLSVVVVGDDLVLIGQGTDSDLPTTLHAALGAEVVHALFMSTVDYYTWTVVNDGGRRTWASGEGEVVVDEGEPLPEESGVHFLDEDALFAMLSARTGITVDSWLGATAQGLQHSPPTDGRKRRRWFGRG